MSKDPTTAEVPHARRKTVSSHRNVKGRLDNPRSSAGADGRSLRSAPAFSCAADIDIYLTGTSAAKISLHEGQLTAPLDRAEKVFLAGALRAIAAELDPKGSR